MSCVFGRNGAVDFQVQSRGHSGLLPADLWPRAEWTDCRCQVKAMSVLLPCLFVAVFNSTPTPCPAFVDRPFIAIFVSPGWCTVSGMINIFLTQRKNYALENCGGGDVHSIRSLYFLQRTNTCTCSTGRTTLNSLHVDTKRHSVLSTWDNGDAQEETTAQTVQGIH